MGNQLLKGYSISGQPIPGVGSNKLWKLFHGTRQSTNASVTIFAIEKRTLKSAERDEILRVAKKQAMGLARLRHPGVLALAETLIEDEQVLAFSTERVIGNLTTLHKQKKLKQIVSNQLELRLNLLSILDTIQFLHQNVKTVHLSLNFDNIYITKEGKWKIAGLGQSQIFNGQGLQMISDFKCDDFSFSSPEVALQQKFERTSDVYSIGLLILNLLFVIHGNYQSQSIRNKNEYEQKFEKSIIKKINNSQLEKLENYKELKLLLKSIFNRDSERRCSLYELSSSKWLNDRLVLTVKYLQSITSYDNKQQVQFLRGLMGVLHDFNRKILLKRIFPTLIDYLKFKHLVPSIIYICVEVAKNGKIINGSEFIDHIWPHLKKVTQGKEMTAHSIFMLVENMSLFQKIISIQDVRETIIPLYLKCFDCPAKLKDLALKKTEYIMAKMDYQFIKTKMVPKIMACMKDSNQQVRKKSLIALKKCIKTLDSQTIVTYVLPGLQNSRKAGTNSFINSITVNIYAELGKSLSTQIISSKLIPTILPYLIDPSVSKNDFYSYKKAMIDMFEKIQFERQKLWEQNQDPNVKIYTEKDFQFAQDNNSEASKSQTEIGKGNFNFLSNYQNARKQEETNQMEPRNQPPNQTPSQQGGMNFGSQQQSTDFNFNAQTNNPQRQMKSPPKNNIDFGALNFQKEDNVMQNFKQQNKQYDPFNFSDPISPQTFQSTNNQQKVLKGPQSKPIKPIRKEPTKNQSIDNPFSSLSSQQKSSNYNDPFVEQKSPSFKNSSTDLNYGGFPAYSDPFAEINKPSNVQSSSLNYPNYNQEKSLGNKDILAQGNDDPFNDFSKNSNSYEMNFQNTNQIYQNTNNQPYNNFSIDGFSQLQTNKPIQNTNMGLNQGNMNQMANNNQMSFDFNQQPQKKKDDFDFDLL